MSWVELLGVRERVPQQAFLREYEDGMLRWEDAMGGCDGASSQTGQAMLEGDEPEADKVIEQANTENKGVARLMKGVVDDPQPTLTLAKP